MSRSNKPVVLAIAGFDPSAGAGVLADIKTISAFGCYGLGVVTSLTMQNTQEVLAATHQAGETITEQLRPLFADFEIAAVKIGMLPTAEAVDAVVSILRTNPVSHIVVDPIVQSTSGYDLIEKDALAALIKLLFPLASVVTPNWYEAERITGISVRDETSAEHAAAAIQALGPRAVLLTGGDAVSPTDLLVDNLGTALYRASKVYSKHTHGTGCALATALACLLGLGRTLRESVPVAKQYVCGAISAAPGLGRGRGPLNHFPPEWTL
ncbi:MAG TPA: bifunctional hydroxymethylpyrimidine kinase/phosphomethylpyrimidine kinase [Blastocatellia bacterium]|nr:bifunctional hydroxymethylpyrimidine kinase/phosphomethylpyrimidine kinase [Blastocatellia bacterium]